MKFTGKVKQITVKELAQSLEIELSGDFEVELSGIASLEKASKTQLSFLDNSKYENQLAKTEAGAVILRIDKVDLLPKNCCGIISDNPQLTYAKALALFYPENSKSQFYKSEFSESKNGASVASSAKIAKGCHIDPFAVISDNVELGENVYIGSGSYIGSGVVIGEGSKIASNVSIIRASVGKRVIIHSGAKIGQDGFGFAYDGDKKSATYGVVKVPQIGTVEISDDVEIGANTSIDCGSLGDTKIGAKTKIDNLVQIAHNVEIGENCQIVSGVGIAGSVKLGNGVIIGGQAGVVGHISIADGVMIASQACVTKSITKSGEVVAGFPAIPMAKWKRLQATITRLVKK